MSVSILIGDCRERMAELDANSVDSCVTDPPYHLTSIVKRFGAANAAPAKVGKTGAYARASKGFMGQTWDGGDVAFQPETWAAVFRVLKPGAHLVAFSGTRTYHRMVCAIEDAGFEIRDQLAWVYGSGFPKSLDVSKAIDRARDDSSEGLAVGAWLKAQREARGLKQKEVAALWPSITGGLTGCVANWETLGKVPKWDQWLMLKAKIGFGDEMDAEVWRLNGRKGRPGENWTVIGEREAGAATGGVYGTFAQRVEINEPTDAARQWQGWGTALKPAWEPICLARKPLIGTVAANVLAHGTGAINIDGCRIGTESTKRTAYGIMTSKGAAGGAFGNQDHEYERRDEAASFGSEEGRWPANIIHDGSDEVLGRFPDLGATAGSYTRGVRAEGEWLHAKEAGTHQAGFGDSGSAARFFYCAKASAEDRGEGNNHPTVKPRDLMRWLCRLVTPTGGTVLDPFAGSGSTLIAADAEQFNAIGCELSPEYAAIAERRLRDAAGMFAEVKAA